MKPPPLRYTTTNLVKASKGKDLSDYYYNSERRALGNSFALSSSYSFVTATLPFISCKFKFCLFFLLNVACATSKLACVAGSPGDGEGKGDLSEVKGTGASMGEVEEE